jgi:predicted transcriptional regulator
MTQPKAVPERLGARERELIDTIFALGNRASAEEIRAQLVDPPGDSSVRVMLARLEKKGFVKHRRDGLRYLYSATASPTVAKRTALQRYLQTFFGGSRQEMLTALITESPWTDDEFDALTAEIDRVRNERKRQS